MVMLSYTFLDIFITAVQYRTKSYFLVVDRA